MHTIRMFAMLLGSLAGCAEDGVNDGASELTPDREEVGEPRSAEASLVGPATCAATPAEVAAMGPITDVVAAGDWVLAASDGRLLRVSPADGDTVALAAGAPIRLAADAHVVYWLDGLNADSRTLMRVETDGDGTPSVMITTLATELVLDGDHLWLLEPDSIVRVHVRTHAIARFSATGPLAMAVDATHVWFLTPREKDLVQLNRIVKATGAVEEREVLFGDSFTMHSDGEHLYIAGGMEAGRMLIADGSVELLAAIAGADFADMDVADGRLTLSDRASAVNLWSVTPGELPAPLVEMSGTVQHMSAVDGCLFFAANDGAAGRIYRVAR